MNYEAVCNDISGRTIEAAVEVHRHLGPGLLESVYEAALAYELQLRNISFERQKALPATYKGRRLGSDYRVDFVVENRIVVELKSVHRLDSVYEAQLLTYLRLSGLWLGLLINFNERLLRHGVKRIVYGRANHI